MVRFGPGLAPLSLLVLAACATPLVMGAGGAVVATTGPSRSMVAVYETAAGVLVVDLGWWGAQDELRATLADMGRDPSDVAAVFLTHGHRDHVAAWPAVRGSTFYLAAAEVPYLFGELEYEGWIPRLADRIADPPAPERGEIEIVTFSADTTFVFGADTVRAFLVPGHTAGSAAYLVRGTVFAGDALTHSVWTGYRHARPSFSDDPEQAARSLLSLFRRLEGLDVELICTAHAQCVAYDDAFRDQVRRSLPPGVTG